MGADDRAGAVRIVQLSDTHLSHLGGVTTDNFRRLARFVDEVLRPDLIVHTGDVVAVTPDHAADRAAAVAALGAVRAPLRVLPGNHDVGEPGGEPWMGLAVTEARLEAHRGAFGPDRFAVELGAWQLIGLNSELLGSGLAGEEEQWRWLSEALSGGEGRPAILFLHKPLWAPRPSSRPGRSVLEAARERLLALPSASSLRAVGSGHLHRYRRRVRPDLLEVWAPSTAFRGRSRPEETHFEQLGVVEWHLAADGTVDAAFRAPHDLDEREAADVPEVADAIALLEAAGGGQGATGGAGGAGGAR